VKQSGEEEVVYTQSKYSSFDPLAKQMLHSTLKNEQQQQPQQYQIPQTQNLRFTKFLDIVFQSKQPSARVKQQIVSYVSALETNYNEKIRQLTDLNKQQVS
jgi:hypothetical protein